MRLLHAFIAHERRTEMRSLRFRAVASGYLALCLAPPLVRFALHARAGRLWGAGTYADALFAVQLPASALVAYVLAADGLSRERDEGSLAVVGLAPLTNAGYLLRRFLALLALLIPLSLLPPLVTALVARFGAGVAVDPGRFAGPWAVEVAPLLIAATAFALGIGTIAGGPVRAAIFAILVCGIGMDLGNAALMRVHRQLASPFDWLDFDQLQRQMAMLQGIGLPGYWSGAVSDAPYDLAATLETTGPRAALGIGISALALVVGASFLRRTRPDHRPWPVTPGHPLRNFVRTANRLREEYHPDPAPTRREKALLAAALVLLAACLLYLDRRHRLFLASASARYQAEVSGGPAPTPDTALPVRYVVRGGIGGDGRVALDVAATFAAHGADPVAHLAFSLNPALSATVAGCGLTKVTRSWDRLSVDLDPPIPPGGERLLAVHLAGAPVSDEIELPSGRSFAGRFETWRDARLPIDLSDLTRSTRLASVTTRRVALVATDLLPVPRYTPWTLTPKALSMEDPGRSVPVETVFPVAELDVDLRVPAGRFLADACGDVARANGEGSASIAGGCRIAPAEFAVRGGPLQALPEARDVSRFAVLAVHRGPARAQVAALADAADLARRAWPGLDPLARAVVMEWPSSSGEETDWRIFWGGRTLHPDSTGRLLLLPEATLTATRPIAAEEVAAEAVAQEVTMLRAVEQREQTFFRELYRALALARMGQRRVTRADLRGSFNLREGATRRPLLAAQWWQREAWNRRLPALLLDLEARIGFERLTAALDQFLAAPGDRPGTARELLERGTALSGVPLERFYSDYIAGQALPQLALVDVAFRRDGPGWEVTGAVENAGTGEALCPVVLHTDLEPASAAVRVDAGQRARFRLKTAYRPRTVLLDPDGRCYRFTPSARVLEGVERVEYREGSGS